MTERNRYIFILFCLTSAGCFNIAGECETTASKRLFNPSGNLQAVSDVTDCGATTSPSYGVRIIEGRDTTELGSRENTILGSRTGVRMEWKSDDTLIIFGADTTSGYTMRNLYQLSNVKGRVVIIYKQ